MATQNNPIGVMDSGVGGLTVVSELAKLLPGEDILYCADNINVPFGNKSKEDIFVLSCNMLKFMDAKKVKMVLLACNTISAMADKLQKEFEFPIISIIEPIAKRLGREKVPEIGLIATEYTVKSSAYKSVISETNSDVIVHDHASKNLAALIDKGDLDNPDIMIEVSSSMGKLMEKGTPPKVILGCTHYPIVEDLFRKAAPGIEFLDPAAEQVLFARDILKADNLLQQGAGDIKGNLDIYTSGESWQFEQVLSRLKLGHANMHSQLFDAK